MAKTSEPNHQPVDVATTAVERLEKLEFGADYQAAFHEAGAAVKSLRAAAESVICPDKIEPVSDAVGRDFEIFCRTLSPVGPLTDALIALHAEAVDSHPELAACIPGARGTKLVRARAALSGVDGEAKALAKFVTAIAGQLHRRNQLTPWSTHLVVTVPDLVGRLESARRRRDEYDKVESQRQADEAAAAEAAQHEQERLVRECEWSRTLASEDQEARARRERLASWYAGTYAAYVFPVGPKTAQRRVTGAEACRNLRAGAPFIDYFRAQGSGELPYRKGA